MNETLIILLLTLSSRGMPPGELMVVITRIKDGLNILPNAREFSLSVILSGYLGLFSVLTSGRSSRDTMSRSPNGYCRVSGWSTWTGPWPQILSRGGGSKRIFADIVPLPDLGSKRSIHKMLPSDANHLQIYSAEMSTGRLLTLMITYGLVRHSFWESEDGIEVVLSSCMRPPLPLP